MSKISPSEAIAHILPTHDLDLADRAIAELDECGYRIVEKDSVDAAPDLPTEVMPLDPAAAALRPIRILRSAQLRRAFRRGKSACRRARIFCPHCISP